MIGAVVLIAIAELLIPPMLSGPRSTGEPLIDLKTQPAGETAKLKTYTIDLSKNQQNPEPVFGSSAETNSATNLPVPSEPASETKAPPPEIAMVEVPSAGAAPSGAQVEQEASKPLPTKAADRSATPVHAPPLPGGWTVQVGSFGVRATSDRIAADLKRQGYSAFVVAFQANNQTMYRVRVGPERDRPAAEVLLRKLKVHHPNAALIPPT